jgi:hypothetical protein
VPNQPKTPARTFRLSDEHMQKLESFRQTGQNLSDAMRGAIDSIAALSEAMRVPRTLAEIGADIREQMGADEVAMHDLMHENELPQLSQVMLNGATRFSERLAEYDISQITEPLRQDERERTIRDIITRLEGHVPSGDVDQSIIDTLKSLLP